MNIFESLSSQVPPNGQCHLDYMAWPIPGINGPKPVSPERSGSVLVRTRAGKSDQDRMNKKSDRIRICVEFLISDWTGPGPPQNLKSRTGLGPTKFKKISDQFGPSLFLIWNLYPGPGSQVGIKGILVGIMGFVIWTFDIFITLKSWIIQFEFDFICLKSWILTNIINKIVPRVVNNFFDYVCRNSVFQTNKISFESNNSRFPFHTNVTFVMVIVEIIKPIISTGLPIISTYSL